MHSWRGHCGAFTYRNRMRYSDAVTPKVMRNAVTCTITL